MTTTHKRRLLHDIEGLSLLPEGQRRAVNELVGGDRARTYLEASEIAGMFGYFAHSDAPCKDQPPSDT